MKKYSLLLIIQFLFTTWCMGQDTLKGIVKNAAGEPLEGVTVKTAKRSIMTPRDGSFKLEVQHGDRISFNYVGYKSVSYVVDKENLAPLVIKMKDDQELHERVVSAISPRSTWTGAKIGYNLDGDAGEEYFGSAKITLNALKQLPEKWHVAVVGNFGNFVTRLNADEGKKGITDLALTLTGLSIGMAGTYTPWHKEKDDGGEKWAIRFYYLPAYRLNTYKNVGADSATVNISQFRNSVGAEFEGLELVKGGKINISAEASLALMDKNRYNLVFKEKKGSLVSLDVTVILPISSQIGFFADATFIQGNKPNYITGIILRP
ncbi:MAG: carboxypeptidase-like regulatory domain-containing protein [Chitinophaga sp.]|uniref:carboxypeptidase-like regulatory domain-containing protein n=1 Tax=Chitinophaga sp. TaxID=1869181 RepID=UPI001B18A320|nr:carboxypeptidase-like regulatory domain-containing protein [Chitinophaga sp.]MBO9729571.1 carboxypeptidase-like regulatory domain-containing protein [Chitinophaga sp.]